MGEHVQKASRETEELYLAIVKDDVAAVYDAIERGADIDFVFGPAYKCLPGYTPLMVAAHRNRLLRLVGHNAHDCSCTMSFRLQCAILHYTSPRDASSPCTHIPRHPHTQS